MEEMTNTNVTEVNSEVQNQPLSNENDKSKETLSSEKKVESETKELSIEDLIQRAVDRATNKLGNDNKKLRQQLDNLKKTKLTEDELKALEIKDREEQIELKEKELLERENKLYAIKAIKSVGLDDGSDIALSLVDFVMGETTDEIDTKVKVFNELVKKFVKSEVDKTFKVNGRIPEKGNGSESANQNKNSLAVDIGKNMAKRNDESNKILNHYLGR